ncbi:hypothetical protein ACFUCV_06730 [Specibacter sp. NPDC057265]|uniref:hypothetical protein n=1 Tax=Specibacter sp. NPDC057265 TaxID=3346075 RepID=UPI00363E2764
MIGHEAQFHRLKGKFGQDYLDVFQREELNFTKTTSVKKFLSVFAIITALFFGSMGAVNASPASPVVAHSVTTVAEESVTPMAGV